MRGSRGADVRQIHERYETQGIRKRLIRELEGINARLADVERDVLRAKCGGDKATDEGKVAMLAITHVSETLAALRRAIEADYKYDAEAGHGS